LDDDAADSFEGALIGAPSPVQGGTFIITGGLGGLGLLSAKVLSRLGAARLVLVSRSGKVPYSDQGLEAELEWLLSESGSEVHILQSDVSDESSVVDLLRCVRELGGGIRGIIHSAGVIRDALIRGGGALSGCEAVWSSKATSAWLLHAHTLQDNLSTFRLCQPWGILGNPLTAGRTVIWMA
jgi:NAD(P)-dependent dehydrogenase (short-subunit alcohol dehydrogenase family)